MVMRLQNLELFDANAARNISNNQYEYSNIYITKL